jgi:hypothetical protein
MPRAACLRAEGNSAFCSGFETGDSCSTAAPAGGVVSEPLTSQHRRGHCRTNTSSLRRAGGNRRARAHVSCRGEAASRALQWSGTLAGWVREELFGGARLWRLVAAGSLRCLGRRWSEMRRGVLGCAAAPSGARSAAGRYEQVRPPGGERRRRTPPVRKRGTAAPRTLRGRKSEGISRRPGLP